MTQCERLSIFRTVRIHGERQTTKESLLFSFCEICFRFFLFVWLDFPIWWRRKSNQKQAITILCSINVGNGMQIVVATRTQPLETLRSPIGMITETTDFADKEHHNNIILIFSEDRTQQHITTSSFLCASEKWVCGMGLEKATVGQKTWLKQTMTKKYF